MEFEEPKAGEVLAIVTSIVTDGNKGPFFFARIANGKGQSITCSLEKRFWKGDRWPVVSEIVILGDISQVKGLLRAFKGRLRNLKGDNNVV